MKSILIRDIPEELYNALKAKAQASAEGALEPWLRAQLDMRAHGPVVKERYTIRIGGVGQIRRFSDALTSCTYKNASQEEAAILAQAERLVKRNEPNDREDALFLLRMHFDDVYETA